MGTRTVHFCDRCHMIGAENSPILMGLQIPVGTQDDPNHGTETRYEEIDLCLECVLSVFNLLSRSIDPKVGRLFVERLRDGPPQKTKIKDPK